MRDLWGNDIPDIEPHTNESCYQRFKRRFNYQKSDDKNKRCKNCGNHINKPYHNGKYHKCKLIGSSCSTATDIRVGHVCDKWETT